MKLIRIKKGDKKTKSSMARVIYLFGTNSFSHITQSSGGVIYHENLILRTHYPFKHSHNQPEQQNAPYLIHSLTTLSRYSISIRASYVTGPCKIITKKWSFNNHSEDSERLTLTQGLPCQGKWSRSLLAGIS